jgi:hypothetical protein
MVLGCKSDEVESFYKREEGAAHILSLRLGVWPLQLRVLFRDGEAER